MPQPELLDIIEVGANIRFVRVQDTLISNQGGFGILHASNQGEVAVVYVPGLSESSIMSWPSSRTAAATPT